MKAFNVYGFSVLSSMALMTAGCYLLRAQLKNDLHAVKMSAGTRGARRRVGEGVMRWLEADYCKAISGEPARRAWRGKDGEPGRWLRESMDTPCHTPLAGTAPAVSVSHCDSKSVQNGI
jgi:hypothetical protein